MHVVLEFSTALGYHLFWWTHQYISDCSLLRQPSDTKTDVNALILDVAMHGDTTATLHLVFEGLLDFSFLVVLSACPSIIGFYAIYHVGGSG